VRGLDGRESVCCAALARQSRRVSALWPISLHCNLCATRGLCSRASSALGRPKVSWVACPSLVGVGCDDKPRLPLLIIYEDTPAVESKHKALLSRRLPLCMLVRPSLNPCGLFPWLACGMKRWRWREQVSWQGDHLSGGPHPRGPLHHQHPAPAHMMHALDHPPTHPLAPPPSLPPRPAPIPHGGCRSRRPQRHPLCSRRPPLILVSPFFEAIYVYQLPPFYRGVACSNFRVFQVSWGGQTNRTPDKKPAHAFREAGER
jgi:hypothetical protein